MDASAANGSVTSLLAEFTRGNRQIESELAGLVSGELRRPAAFNMRRERRSHTLQTTAVVHEAWARLGDSPNVAWQNRAHFFAIASRHMRQILVDHARYRNAARRGGRQVRLELDNNIPGEQPSTIDLLALNEALYRLKALDLRACRIAELHFFGGLTFDETAPALEISDRTVKRDWSMAQAFLHNELAKKP